MPRCTNWPRSTCLDLTRPANGARKAVRSKLSWACFKTASAAARLARTSAIWGSRNNSGDGSPSPSSSHSFFAISACCCSNASRSLACSTAARACVIANSYSRGSTRSNTSSVAKNPPGTSAGDISTTLPDTSGISCASDRGETVPSVDTISVIDSSSAEITCTSGGSTTTGSGVGSSYESISALASRPPRARMTTGRTPLRTVRGLII